jgi:Fe-Mn family superoxide dismutase
MKNKQIKQIISDSLGLTKEDQQLDESFVASKKVYKLNTDMLSAKNKENHFKVYQGYVDSFNRTSAELDTADRSSSNPLHSVFKMTKENEVDSLNSVWLHELFFANVGDIHSEISMNSLSFMRLERDFGSFDAWQKDFIACTSAAKSGWAVLGYNMFLNSYMNVFIEGNATNVPVGFMPIIVMDTHQHAYYRDYLGDVRTYVVAMMKELNWEVIESRFAKVDSMMNPQQPELGQ